jgi:hypothetical protein
VQGDFPAIKMINSVHGIDEARKQRLIKVGPYGGWVL